MTTPLDAWLRATRAYGADWHKDPLRRMAATRHDPLLFGLLYLPHHLKGDETGGAITLSEAHLEWVEMAKRWEAPLSTEPAAERDGIIAPRGMGKSTWWFLALPLWAAAHGWVRFIAAFADSATQAETHLSTFRLELERNAMLRQDYPLLCKPAVDARGALIADRDNQYQATSGFIFAARGIDTSSLGLKVEDARPDLIILDDIEPAEAKYSGELAKKRLGTIQDAILPLNVFARVVIVGTVTMPGSIVHQLVKVAKGRPDESTDWVVTERIRPHYYPAIAVDPETGEERSTWPEKWPLGFLVGIRHTRQYAKNYANDPMGYDGDYWRAENFHRVGPEALEGVVRTLLSIDPAVTSKKSSDETGLGVIGHDPVRARCVVKRVAGVRLPPKEIRLLVLRWLREDPSIGAVLVEVNQGGDTWKAILHDLPVPVLTKHQSVKKEVRAANVLNRYERGMVVHLEGGVGIDRAEEQMLGFPKADHDDLVDCIGTGVAYFLMRKKKRAPSGASASYI